MEKVRALLDLLAKGENARTEFKRFLAPKDLKPDRRAKLQAQLRLICNFESGTFVVGVEDLRGERWEVFPLTEEQYKTSRNVLKALCEPIDLVIEEEEKICVDGGFVGVFKVGPKPVAEVRSELIVNLVGRVNSGKSTLVGVLTTGEPDDGSGLARASMLVHPQEVRRGQTADLHLAFLGLDKEGNRMRPEADPDFRHGERVITDAARLLIFYDAPGHQEYSRTMLRSVLGGHGQYAFLLVPVFDEYKLVKAEETRTGLTRLDPITREQLILISQAQIPFVVVLNKVDKTSSEELHFVRGLVKKTLRQIKKVPYPVRDAEDLQVVLREMCHGALVPVVEASCVTLQGVDLLFELLRRAPVTTEPAKFDVPALAYIDKVYRGIKGTNVVVTGTVTEGLFKPGQAVKLFPVNSGRSVTGRLQSIEVFHRSVERVKAGEVFGFDLHNVPKEKVRRGQVVADVDFPLEAVREFEAKIVVTYHSVLIRKGYSPVCQVHTVNQAVQVVHIEEKPFLSLGDVATVRLRFIKRPEFVRVGDKIFLREGNLRGFGTVTRVFPLAKKEKVKKRRKKDE
ncbi:MAG: GTP-binding protein [Promethearchaeota archaeon]